MIGASFGGSDFHIKDEHASPLIFSSIGIAPALQYIYTGAENRHSFEGQFYYGYLATMNNNFHTDDWRGRARYSYVHLLSVYDFAHRNIELLLGGSISSFFNRADYYYAWNSSHGTSIISWYWSHSLDIAFQIECRPFLFDGTENTGETFSIFCNVPVLSNVSRPKYSSSGNYNYDENTWKIKPFGETKLFPQNISIDITCLYQFPVSDKIRFQLSYEFFYAAYNKPKEMILYMNNLRTGVLYCF